MLELRDVRKSYTTGDFTQVALDDVSIAFRDNEFVAVLGPSGSGKTTMLNLIGGLDQYDSGDLIIDGVSTGQYRDRDWDTYRNNRVGFVFQSYNLIDALTAAQNTLLPARLARRRPGREDALKALDEVGLRDRADHRPHQLSGGEQQRVAIARAVLTRPSVICADEPTGALDLARGRQVLDHLRAVVDTHGRTVLVVTHDPAVAARADRVVFMADGRIVDEIDAHDGARLDAGSIALRMAGMEES